MNLFISNFYTIFNDAPQPWQLGFQDSAAPGFTGLVTLHNTIGFYLIVISIAVSWTIFSLVYYYSEKNNPIAHKYLTHGTVLELIWTITPALILIAIAFPSFRLLYLMDIPCVDTVRIITFSAVPVKSLTSSCTSLVPLGETGLTLNIRFTNLLRNNTYFPKHIISQLIGHLLGDGFLYISNTSVTPCFIFTQTIKKFDYVWHVFQKLGHFCNRIPLIGISRRKGQVYPFLQVMTRSYPYFLTFYQLFYIQRNGKFVKTISPDLINYLDPVCLAYWAMDDGSANTKLSGFYLHTKGFNFKETYLLCGMLHYQFGLKCTVQNHQKMPVIYITSKSVPLFISLVTPHFHPSMMYKLANYINA